MIDWFVVRTDDSSVSLSVSPPGRSAWQAVIPWDSVARVCFEVGFLASDDLYIFTSLRPESWLVPAEADGGQELLQELIRRGLFDASLAITAAQAHEGIFCWPPLHEPDADRED
jgi:hypothetical protein